MTASSTSHVSRETCIVQIRQILNWAWGLPRKRLKWDFEKALEPQFQMNHIRIKLDPPVYNMQTSAELTHPCGNRTHLTKPLDQRRYSLRWLIFSTRWPFTAFMSCSTALSQHTLYTLMFCQKSEGRSNAEGWVAIHAGPNPGRIGQWIPILCLRLAVRPKLLALAWSGWGFDAEPPFCVLMTSPTHKPDKTGKSCKTLCVLP